MDRGTDQQNSSVKSDGDKDGVPTSAAEPADGLPLKFLAQGNILMGKLNEHLLEILNNLWNVK